MIQFDQVTKKYPNGHQALSQVSFAIEPGQIAFLTGNSGAGKSTLLKLIMLLEKPSQGSVIVNKQNVAHIKRRHVPLYRRQIGMVHQNHQLLFDRSVFDNVALPLVVSGYQPKEIGRRVRAALDKVGLLSKEKLNPINLSGGEQQRVGIARAVVNKPSILLADEPTGNLDPDLSADTMDLFMQFSRVGVAVLIASHDLALIERYKHRQLALDKGRLLSGALG
ncbi:MAG: cell division ATP-binding protein FtsE [Moraxellaceae bacterium]|nr:MAG: cell division ATP-binding protein FtsE [Moraxellaceae bacterium]